MCMFPVVHLDRERHPHGGGGICSRRLVLQRHFDVRTGLLPANGSLVGRERTRLGTEEQDKCRCSTRAVPLVRQGFSPERSKGFKVVGLSVMQLPPLNRIPQYSKNPSTTQTYTTRLLASTATSIVGGSLAFRSQLRHRTARVGYLR